MTCRSRSKKRRRALIVGLPLALLMVLGLAACGGDGRASLAAGGPTVDRSDEVLASQSASLVTLSHGSGNAYWLTMKDPAANTLYFTDSPERSARLAPVARLPLWLRGARAREGYAPNVTVNWDGEPGGASTSIVARLQGARYERADKTLRFSLRSLRLPSGAPAITGARTAARGPATMVIDGMGGMICRAGIGWGEPPLQLESSHLSHGEWNAAPPKSIGPGGAEIEASSDGFMTGCEFLTRYGDGKGNAVEIGVDVPFIGYPSYTCHPIGELVCTVQEWETGTLNVNISQRPQ